MTIDEAIKLLTRWQEGKDITSFDDVNRAAKLGIEGLKALEVYRSANQSWLSLPLPGETEE